MNTSKVHIHRTRSVSNDAMYITRGASNNFNKTFAYYGAKTWNSLPCALNTLANLYALLWWIRHTEAGYYANVVGYYA